MPSLSEAKRARRASLTGGLNGLLSGGQSASERSDEEGTSRDTTPTPPERGVAAADTHTTTPLEGSASAPQLPITHTEIKRRGSLITRSICEFSSHLPSWQRRKSATDGVGRKEEGGSNAVPAVPEQDEGDTPSSGSRRFISVFGDVCPGQIGLHSYAAAMTRSGVGVQGRLYLSDQSVCFASPISSRLVVVPYRAITQMLKKRYAGLPTAIRVVVGAGEQTYFFHSMLARNDCHREMVALWMKNNNENHPGTTTTAACEGDGDEPEDDEGNPPDDDPPSPRRPATSTVYLLGGDQNQGTTGSSDKDDGLAADCACSDHLERVTLDQWFNVPAHTLYSLMFADQSAFMTGFLTNVRQCQNLTMGQWEKAMPEEGKPEHRRIEFTTPLKRNAIGPRSADVVELQYLLRCEPSRVYVVLSESCTPKLPYGDIMVTRVRYCIMRMGHGVSRLLVTGGVHFKKSPGIVKPVLVRSSLPMLDDFCMALANTLQRHVTGSSPSQASDPSANQPATNTPTHRVEKTMPPQTERMGVMGGGKVEGWWWVGVAGLLAMLVVLVAMLLVRIGTMQAALEELSQQLQVAECKR